MKWHGQRTQKELVTKKEMKNGKCVRGTRRRIKVRRKRTTTRRQEQEQLASCEQVLNIKIEEEGEEVEEEEAIRTSDTYKRPEYDLQRLE